MLLRQSNNGPITLGVNDGDALVWNATLGEWFPGTAGAPGSVVSIGGDQSEAEDDVTSGTTAVLVTNAFAPFAADTPVRLFFTTTVKLQNSAEVAGQVSAWFDVVLDDNPLPILTGCIVVGDATNFDPYVTAAFSGFFVIPAGEHVVKVRCTAGPNTTAKVNPAFGEGIHFSRTETLIFEKA